MLPALPLIAVGIAAAAAGWAGAQWWAKRRRHDDAAPPSDPSDAVLRPRGDAQTLSWCPGCRTWFVAADAHGCDQPECPLRPGG
jgi:hypothetical protein